MGNYVYVGSISTIGDKKLNRVGQRFECSEKHFAELVTAGCVALIPQEYFDSVGFTTEELDRYGTEGSQVLGPSSFQDKLSKARDLFRDIRRKLKSGGRVGDLVPPDVSFEKKSFSLKK